MVAETMSGARTNDDPLKLISLLARVSELASEHSVPSVFAGLRCETGNAEFPGFLDYLESTLRVEDAIFRMTRERAVVHLADIDQEGAREVLGRVLADFRSECPAVEPSSFDMRLYQIDSGVGEVRAKVLLPALFAPRQGGAGKS